MNRVIHTLEARASPWRPTARRQGAHQRGRRFVRVQNASRDEDDTVAEAIVSSPSLSSVSDRCESGDPDFDLCTVSFDGGETIEREDIDVEEGISVVSGGRSSEGGQAAAWPGSSESADSLDNVSITKSAISEAYERGKWLVGLLVLQSSSSFVLDKYQDLIREHLVVTLFLTMLVGAGGNAGNQSAIKVIRGMATGSITPTLDSLQEVMKQQITVAFILGTSLSAAGWVRVYVTNGSALNSSAIAFSLFLIVCTSVIVGTLLPFGLARAGQDPANAGTSIQVLMDVLGVLITCVSCNFILDKLAL